MLLAFFIRDDTETLLYLSSIGKYIVDVLGDEDFTEAENILKGIQFNIEY